MTATPPKISGPPATEWGVAACTRLGQVSIDLCSAEVDGRQLWSLTIAVGYTNMTLGVDGPEVVAELIHLLEDVESGNAPAVTEKIGTLFGQPLPLRPDNEIPGRVFLTRYDAAGSGVEITLYPETVHQLLLALREAQVQLAME